MRQKKAPRVGRKVGFSDKSNATATSRKFQSRARQRQSLLRWLSDFKQITTLQARNNLGIMHPAGRIKELRRAGFSIATYWKWDTDATGKQHRQALYVLLASRGGGK